MSEITLNPDQLKEILKSAIVELIRDNREEVSEFLAETLEDLAMEQAIAEGEATEFVSRESIFQLLEPKREG
jgi:dsDNA-binding SOS-regulon protein